MHRRDGTFRTIVHFLRRLAPYRLRIAGTYGMMVAVAVISLAIPQFIRWIVDRGIRGADTRVLASSVVALLALAAARAVGVYLQGRWSEIASQGVAYDLREALHRKLSSLSFAYHDGADTGQLLSRSIQDVERIRFLTGRAFLRVVEGTVLVVATAIVLIVMDARLATVSLAILPILGYQSYRYGSRIRPLSITIQEQLGALTSRVQQNLAGMRIVKAYALEESEIKRFEAENESWLAVSYKAASLEAVQHPLLQLLANLGTVAVVLFGGWAVIRGRLSMGEFVAFNTYLAQLVMPVRRIGNVIPALSIAGVAGERILEILEAESEVSERPDAIELTTVDGVVSFQEVSFSYFARHAVLRDVTFTARPGQVVALVGGPGSGKSTIINLIPRFYDPDAGSILIDDCDIRAFTLTSLRRHIGIVLQETFLFAGTVRENIAFGRPEATAADIEAAAAAAQAAEFIELLPRRYDTPVGERGITLSGGQKQRIAIARALLLDPKVLILDDATSSVDAGTERLIRRALETLMRGRTSFVIAHRLATVVGADTILVMERGRVVATGRHEELLRTSGAYVEIFRTQYRDDGPERSDPVHSGGERIGE